MGQYDDIECALAMCILHNFAKHKRDHHDAIKRIEIRLKTPRHDIPATRHVVEHTIDGLLSMMSKGRRSHDSRDDSPCFYKCHRILRTDTCCLANDLISRLRTLYVSVLIMFCTVRVKCLSSLLEKFLKPVLK